jgi:hypothetical protein
MINERIWQSSAESMGPWEFPEEPMGFSLLANVEWEGVRLTVSSFDEEPHSF